jgi:predicted nucleotidyltransferase
MAARPGARESGTIRITMELATKDRVDRAVAYVVGRASQLLDVERVWLFGSQALGTATPHSDVDLAFRLLPGSRERWARFVLECEEEVPALVDLDLVDVDQCDPALAHEIVATGRVVYERAA